MSDTVITVENLSKRYLVGHEGPRERYHSLRDTIVRHGRNFARKTLDMARGRQIVQGDEVEEFWALKDVSFEVKRGEVLGIIGRNGAGKSTLLKVLSRITEPTAGRVVLDGRVASLLEVGTGFHPELTGRENIFLNGAILGMSKAEIRRKFDEIVDFSGVEKFLDTPVKRYSSGMYVRLAFAVAAHLEPEILIVDEVLAVGDAEFQKKCMGKMEDVAKGGRTVLLVSHNLGQIRSLCSSALFLKAGSVALQGTPHEAVSLYESSRTNDLKRQPFVGPLSKSIDLLDAHLETKSGGTDSFDRSSQPRIVVSTRLHEALPELKFTFVLFANGNRVCNWEEARAEADGLTPKGELQVSCKIPVQYLVPGIFSIGVGCCSEHASMYAWNSDVLQFTLLEDATSRGFSSDQGIVSLPASIVRSSAPRGPLPAALASGNGTLQS